MNMKLKSRKLLSFFIIFGLFSCYQGKIDPIDTKVAMRKSEFDDVLIKKRKQDKKDEETTFKSAMPKLAKLEVMPPKPISENFVLDNHRTISFSVNEDIDLKDVLIELGRAAQIDVDIDPNISGKIVMSAHNRPLSEIVQRICDLGNLRYTYKNRVLSFEKDTPYLKNYMVDYLVEGSNLWADVESNITSITGSSAIEGSKAASFSVNKSAGIMSIFASKKQHELIERYLKAVQMSASSQVLIEAKLVEVKLNDEYKTGINWNSFNKQGGSDIPNFNNFKLDGGFSDSDPLKLILSGGIDVSISALEQFGTTRTLSSPRLHAINNQKATLNFTEKLVYFTIVNTATNTGGTNAAVALTETVSSTKNEEDAGVELTITPSINFDSGEITLNVNPKITVKTQDIVDPASPEGFTNLVPVIQTRELTTVAKIQNGNVIVIGGLMQEKTENVDIGVPFLQRIPVLGNLFKSVSKVSNVTETVIFIKATIIKSGSQVDEVDREIQDKFDSSKRKFF